VLDLKWPQFRPQDASVIIFNGFVQKLNIQFKYLGTGRKFWDFLCDKLAFIHPKSYPRIAMVTFCNNNMEEWSSVSRITSRFTFCLLFFMSDGRFRGSPSSV